MAWYKPSFRKQIVPFFKQQAASQASGGYSPGGPYSSGGGNFGVPPGAAEFGFDVGKDYYEKRGHPTTGMPGEGEIPLSWLGAENWNQLFGQNADPTGQFFGRLDVNNPLATSVGKYGVGYLGLLNSPEFAKLRGFEGDPEFQRVAQSARPDYYLSAGEGAISRSVGQGQQEGLAALRRGGLRGSGAEAALRARGGYGRAMALGSLSNEAQKYAADQSERTYMLRRKGLGDVLNFRQGVLDRILDPVLQYKGQRNTPVDWAGTAIDVGKGIGAIAALGG